MLYRLRTYLTVLSTLLLPAVLVLWARSYVSNDTFLRAGNGWMLALDSMQGELSLWTARLRPAPTHYRWDSVDVAAASTASQIIHSTSGRRRFSMVGVMYAELDVFPSGQRPVAGVVRCVVVPAWMLAMLLAVLPARLLIRHGSTPEREPDAPSASPQAEAPAPPIAAAPEVEPQQEDASPPRYPGYPTRRQGHRPPRRMAPPASPRL